jgi:UDP-N-acetyl-D-galactosamine dehydrogenase
VIDIYNELIEFGVKVEIYDPLVNKFEVKKEYGIDLALKLDKYDAIIYAVPHNIFSSLDFSLLKKSKNSVIFDLKGVLSKTESNGRL